MNLLTLIIHYTWKPDTRSLCKETQQGLCSNMFCEFKPAAYDIHLQDKIHGDTRVTVWNRETTIYRITDMISSLTARTLTYTSLAHTSVSYSSKLHEKIRCCMCKLWLWKLSSPIKKVHKATSGFFNLVRIYGRKINDDDDTVTLLCNANRKRFFRITRNGNLEFLNSQ
jgi:hypothetical protein